METREVTITKIKSTCSVCGKTNIKNARVGQCKVCQVPGTIIAETIIVEQSIEQFCPICNQYFNTSTYLNSIFTDAKVRWLANMVTHYRHQHLTSWDKCWGNNRIPHYKHNLHLDYETEKIKVNERGKRQILRKCLNQMKTDGFTVNDVMSLRNTDTQTIELYRKLLK